MTEQLIQSHGVTLCAEVSGDPVDPAILLLGSSMLSWPDEFCARLVAGKRFVIRYDLRDTGRSVSYPTGSPAYTLRDLVKDAAGVLDAFDVESAHVVAFSSGGWIGQLLTLDEPQRVSSLTLIAARPVAPGPVDPDLPEHDPKIMEFFSCAPQPDWSDRDAVVDHLVASNRVFAGSLPFDENRALAERVVDRTENVASSLTNIAFIDHGERWRERLGEISVPALVIHGTDDPFFPLGNGKALAAEIPGARWLPIDGMGHELPRAAWDEIVPAILRLTS